MSPIGGYSLRNIPSLLLPLLLFFLSRAPPTPALARENPFRDLSSALSNARPPVPANVRKSFREAVDQFQAISRESESSICHTVFEGHRGGLGSQIHALSNRLLLAIYRGAPLVLDTSARSNYSTSGRASELFDLPTIEKTKKIVASSSPECSFRVNEQCFWSVYALPRNDDASGAQKLRSDPSRAFLEFLSSESVRYVTRRRRRSAVEGETSSSSCSPRTLAVHVRRGDKREGDRHGDDLFVRRIAGLVRRFGYDRVLLGSDDPSSFVRFRARLPFLHWVWAEESDDEDGPSETGKTRSTGAFLLERTRTMAKCGGFLGTLSSNLGRLVYELQGDVGVWEKGASNFPPAFFDMDGLSYFPCPFAYPPPWGAGWSMRVRLGEMDVWDARGQEVVRL